MRLIEIINENCSYGNMREELEKALHTLKPFSRSNTEIPFEKLEKLATKYMCKYNVNIQWIRPSARDDKIWYGAEVSIIDIYKPYLVVHAGSMYELYAKICLAMFLAVNDGTAETWEAVNERRWSALKAGDPVTSQKNSQSINGTEKSRKAKNSTTKKGGIYEELLGKRPKRNA